jgi:hypothetical protein
MQRATVAVVVVTVSSFFFFLFLLIIIIIKENKERWGNGEANSFPCFFVFIYFLTKYNYNK